MNYLIIERLSNSFGRGYCITADIGGKCFPERSYYGYSLQDAIRKYRDLYGLRGKHLIQINI